MDGEQARQKKGHKGMEAVYGCCLSPGHYSGDIIQERWV